MEFDEHGNPIPCQVGATASDLERLEGEEEKPLPAREAPHLVEEDLESCGIKNTSAPGGPATCIRSSQPAVSLINSRDEASSHTA